jgi:hypothetical protein
MLHPNDFLSQFGLLGLWTVIASHPNLRSRGGLNQCCSYRRELSNAVLHSPSARREWVDSRLLVVRSQTANLTLGPSFAHNLGCRCPNDSCKAILDIYTSIPFQRYKEHLNARCFDPCNLLLNFRESRRTPNSHFRECEWRPQTSFKVGLRQWCWLNNIFGLKFNISSPHTKQTFPRIMATYMCEKKIYILVSWLFKALV